MIPEQLYQLVAAVQRKISSSPVFTVLPSAVLVYLGSIQEQGVRFKCTRTTLTSARGQDISLQLSPAASS